MMRQQPKSTVSIEINAAPGVKDNRQLPGPGIYPGIFVKMFFNQDAGGVFLGASPTFGIFLIRVFN